LDEDTEDYPHQQSAKRCWYHGRPVTLGSRSTHHQSVGSCSILFPGFFSIKITSSLDLSFKFSEFIYFLKINMD
jgi:hypothetical protein